MSKESESHSRNGFYRRGKISQIIEGITSGFHEHFPKVTPNHLTIAGLTGVTLASAYSTYEQNRKGEKYYTQPSSMLFASSLIIGSMLLDAFDGSLARMMQKKDPFSHDSSFGQLLDGGTDRLSELALGINRIIGAHNRGDTRAEIAALTATLTNALPSILRAVSETQGKVVPEAGNGFIGFFGTRVGRSAANTIGTLIPKPKGVPIQEVADWITTAANTKTTLDRLHVVLTPQNAALAPVARKDAQARTLLYLATTGVVFLTSLGAYRLLHNQQPKTH